MQKKQKNPWTRSGRKEYELYIRFVKSVEKLEALRRRIYSAGVILAPDGSSGTALDYVSIAIFIGRTESQLSSLSGLVSAWEKYHSKTCKKKQKRSTTPQILKATMKKSKKNSRRRMKK